MDQMVLIGLWVATAIVAVLYFMRRRARKMKEWKSRR